MGTEMRRRMAAFGLSESFLPRYWSFWALLLGQSLPCMLKLILVRMQRLFSGWTGRTLSLMLRKIWDGWFWLSSRKECILDKDRERRSHWGKCGQSIIDMWDRQFDFMETIRSAEGVLFHMFSQREQYIYSHISASHWVVGVVFRVRAVRRLMLTCMRVRYTGLFIKIHVAVSKHGGMVIDPS